MKIVGKSPVWFLLVVSQLPVLILFWFFISADGLSFTNRFFATLFLLAEAVLFFELIMAFVKKVLVTSSGIVIRSVLSRSRIPWYAVVSVRQLLVSPMNQGDVSIPVKFIVAEVKKSFNAPLLSNWWIKNKPSSSRLGNYVRFVSSQVRDFIILDVIYFNSSQKVDSDVLVDYVLTPFDSLEFRNLLLKFGGKKSEFFDEIIDLSYPSFLKSRGGEVSSCWEDIRSS